VLPATDQQLLAQAPGAPWPPEFCPLAACGTCSHSSLRQLHRARSTSPLGLAVCCCPLNQTQLFHAPTFSSLGPGLNSTIHHLLNLLFCTPRLTPYRQKPPSTVAVRQPSTACFPPAPDTTLSHGHFLCLRCLFDSHSSPKSSMAAAVR
jgi:hypothetical protein